MIDENAIQALLEKYRSLLPGSIPTTVQHFSLLMDIAAQQEFKEEFSYVENLCKDIQSLPENFALRCIERDERNRNTCLSFTAAPFNFCNTFYWEMAVAIFQPKNFADILSILFPKLKKCLAVDIQFIPATQTTRRKIRLILDETDLAYFKGQPEQAKLQQIIMADNIIFDINQIALFNLDMHQEFYHLIKSKYPLIANKLYKHNETLDALLNHINILDKAGLPPRIAIERLITAFEIGGQYFTGQVYATLSAQVAYTEFKGYLNSLPKAFYTELLTQTGINGHNFKWCIEQLDQEKCVENIAVELRGILNNKNNKLVNCRPTFTKQEIANISKPYKFHPSHNNPGLAIHGQEHNANIPEKYLEMFLSSIKISDISEFILFMVNFPPQKYKDLLMKIQMDFIPYNTFHRVSEVLNVQQSWALCKVFLDNWQHFKNIEKDVLHFLQKVAINFTTEQKNELVDKLLIIDHPIITFGNVLHLVMIHTDCDKLLSEIIEKRHINSGEWLYLCNISNVYEQTFLEVLIVNSYLNSIKLIFDKIDEQNIITALIRRNWVSVFQKEDVTEFLLSYCPSELLLNSFLFPSIHKDVNVKSLFNLTQNPQAVASMRKVLKQLPKKDFSTAIYYFFLVNPQLGLQNTQLLTCFIDIIQERLHLIPNIKKLNDKIPEILHPQVKNAAVGLLNQLLCHISKGDCYQEADQIAQVTDYYLFNNRAICNKHYIEATKPFWLQLNPIVKYYNYQRDIFALKSSAGVMAYAMGLFVPVVFLYTPSILNALAATQQDDEVGFNKESLLRFVSVAGVVMYIFFMTIFYNTVAKNVEIRDSYQFSLFSNPPLFKREVEAIATAHTDLALEELTSDAQLPRLVNR